MVKYCVFDYTDCNFKGVFPIHNSVFVSVPVYPKFLGAIIGIINAREEIKEREDVYYLRRLRHALQVKKQIKLNCGTILRLGDVLIAKKDEYCFINEKAYKIIYQELDCA